MKTVNVKSLGASCPYLISLQSSALIGQGSYGKVIRAYNRENPTEDLVAKIFTFSDAKKHTSALQELKVISQVPSHDNLITYKKVKISSKNSIYMIMGRCVGSLKGRILDRWAQKENRVYGNINSNTKSKNQKEIGLFQEKEVWKLIFEFTQGYKVLYQHGIIHRDIKPENILIGKDEKYKIGDFGLAELIQELSQEESRQKPKGSLFFMAPELLLIPNNNPKNCSVTDQNDVYSLGVTIFQMCFGVFPYINKNHVSGINEFMRSLKSNKLEFPQEACYYSKELIDLMESMLEKDPYVRCKWEYIFMRVGKIKKEAGSFSQELPKDNQQFWQCDPSTPILQQNVFRIVEISDTLLKNLSLMDLKLQQSLNKDSLVIVDHIEAEILSKRDFVFFCDQLYVRLAKLCDKIDIIEDIETIQNENFMNRPNTRSSESSIFKAGSQLKGCNNKLKLQLFGRDILLSNYLYSCKLYVQFDGYYSKIQKSQFLKIVTSKKYEHLKMIIEQDFRNLKDLMSQEGVLQPKLQTQGKEVQQNILQVTNLSMKITNANVNIYQQCGKVVQILLRSGYFHEAVEVDQLEQWYQKKPKSILFKTRKNENALRQFKVQLSNMTKEDLRMILSSRYHYLIRDSTSFK